jgi:hypothetical protein
MNAHGKTPLEIHFTYTKATRNFTTLLNHTAKLLFSFPQNAIYFITVYFSVCKVLTFFITHALKFKYTPQWNIGQSDTHFPINWNFYVPTNIFYTGRLMAGTEDLYPKVLVLIQTAISNYLQGPFLPDKLTIARLLKRFPKHYEIQWSIIMFTTAYHWTLSCAK